MRLLCTFVVFMLSVVNAAMAVTIPLYNDFIPASDPRFAQFNFNDHQYVGPGGPYAYPANWNPAAGGTISVIGHGNANDYQFGVLDHYYNASGPVELLLHAGQSVCIGPNYNGNAIGACTDAGYGFVDINNQNILVGTSYFQGYIGTPDLLSVFSNFTTDFLSAHPGLVVVQADQINNQNVVFGEIQYSTGPNSSVIVSGALIPVAAVPEPSSMLLLGTALVAFTYFVRRRPALEL